MRREWLLGLGLAAMGAAATADPVTEVWLDELLAVPASETKREADWSLQFLRQDHERPRKDRSVIDTPLAIGRRAFEHGLGTHSVSHIRVASTVPLERFTAWTGVDHNAGTRDGRGSVVFVVVADGKEVWRSGVRRGGQDAEWVDVHVHGAKVLDLHVEDGGDGPAFDHADWADATVLPQKGGPRRLDEIPADLHFAVRPPFSFAYGGRPAQALLPAWPREEETAEPDADRRRRVVRWTDPATGLRVEWESTRYRDFPAAEWVLRFANTGQTDSFLIEDVQALDAAIEPHGPAMDLAYRLHRTNGAPSNPSDFEVSTAVIDTEHPQTLAARGGRSSNGDFPFFKVEADAASFIVAVGWSGQWAARVERHAGSGLRMTAGLERTRFLLHPGEQVRSPRILVMPWEGDTLEANARFRQLIFKHYAAARAGAPAPPEGPAKPLPTPFCNTCFTRGGGWLNECNAENQISLIKAYAPLGLEALLTDAGWFEGGWPAGAGNWTPRKDAYPQGMGPVAAAAKENGLIYGLWFEPERVVAGTWLHKNRPEWVLSSRKEPQDTYLLDFGRAEVQDYFFAIVKELMDLPGFRVYRQDFNMDPLPYWRFHDAPDRQGVTEMKYIEGLYAYWDRLAAAWPDSFREECASGGRRIDLETILRLHVHQKSDYWFDDDTDQASLWGLSQYLPNGVISVPIDKLDDYAFHSTMASSLIPGWIADAPGFDAARAKRYLGRYREVRHLLVGAWYPLLPYSRDRSAWIASQYHRPDLDEGMILVFRRAESRYRATEVAMRGLDPAGTYEFASDRTGEKAQVKGADAMERLQLTLPQRRQSDLIVYRRVKDDRKKDGGN